MGQSVLEKLIVVIGTDMREFHRDMQTFQRNLRRSVGPEAMAASEDLTRALKVLAGGALLAAGAGIKLHAANEQNVVAFTTLLGSAEEADRMMRRLADFASKTPFAMPGLVEATKRMLAYGFSVREVLPTLRAVGDAAAGLGMGAEGIDRITLALGQIRAKGKVSAEEMRQLAEAGIPAWEMLAQRIGVSIPEAMKMAERGAISAEAGISALVDGMNAKFGGMMNKQARTLGGAWSNALDEVGLLLKDFGAKLASRLDLTGALSGLTDGVKRFRDALEKSGLKAAIDAVFSVETRNSVLIVAAAIMGAMIPALTRAAAATWAAIVPLAPYALGAAAVAGVALQLYRNWDKVSNFLERVWSTAIGKATVALISFVTATKLAAVIAPAASAALGTLTFAFQAVAGGAATLGEALMLTAPHLLAIVGVAAAVGAALWGISAGFNSVSDSAAQFRKEDWFTARGKAFHDLEKDLAVIAEKEKYMGREYDANRERVTAYQRAIDHLLENGYKASHPLVQQLVRDMEKYGGALDAEAKAAEQARLAEERAAEARRKHAEALKNATDALQEAGRLRAQLEGIPDLPEWQQMANNLRELAGQVPELADELVLMAEGLEKAGRVEPLTRVAKGLEEIERRERLLGDSYDDLSAQIELYESALNSALDAGILSEAEIKSLSATLEALKKKQKDATDAEEQRQDRLEALAKAQEFLAGLVEKTLPEWERYALRLEEIARSDASLRDEALRLASAIREQARAAAWAAQVEQDAADADLAVEQHKERGRRGVEYLADAHAALGRVLGWSTPEWQAQADAIREHAKELADSHPALYKALNAQAKLIETLGAARDLLYELGNAIGIDVSALDQLVSAVGDVANAIEAAASGNVVGAVLGIVRAFQKLGEIFEEMSPRMREARREFEQMQQSYARLADKVGSAIDMADSSWVRLTDQAQSTFDKLEDLQAQLEKQADMTPFQQWWAKLWGNWVDESEVAGYEAALAFARTFTAVAASLSDGLESALESGMRAFLEGAADWEDQLRDGIRSAIIDAVVEAVMQGAVIQGALSQLLTDLTQALAEGNYAAAQDVINRIAAAVPELTSLISDLLGPLQGTINAALPASSGAGGGELYPTLAPAPVSGVTGAGKANRAAASQTIIIELDGRELTRATVSGTPGTLRLLQGRA